MLLGATVHQIIARLAQPLHRKGRPGAVAHQPLQPCAVVRIDTRAGNLALFEQLYPHHKDRAKVIAVAKQGRAQLEEQMARSREQLAQQRLADGRETTPASPSDKNPETAMKTT